MTPLVQERTELVLDVAGPAVLDLTPEVAAWLGHMRARDGLLTVFLRHGSASLAIQDSVDPKLRAELFEALKHISFDASTYRYDAERPDGMPAHIRSILTSVSLSIPVFEHAMALGPRQGIVLVEHRARPLPRAVALHFIGSRN